MFGSWVSLGVSSLVFGGVHLMNPQGTLTGAIYISIEAGLLLAAAFMLTAPAVAMHRIPHGVETTRNRRSFPASSPAMLRRRRVLIRSNIRGPEILTGGSFGMEASLVAFAVCTATGIVLLVMAARDRPHSAALSLACELKGLGRQGFHHDPPWSSPSYDRRGRSYPA